MSKTLYSQSVFAVKQMCSSSKSAQTVKLVSLYPIYKYCN